MAPVPDLRARRIDNAYVIKVIKIIENHWDVIWPPGSPNHDLLTSLTNILRQTRQWFSGVFKVYSHQKM